MAVVLELIYPGYLPWAYGLTSGAVALVVNLAIYVAAAYLIPQSREERQRVEELFELIEKRSSASGSTVPKPSASDGVRNTIGDADILVRVAIVRYDSDRPACAGRSHRGAACPARVHGT